MYYNFKTGWYLYITIGVLNRTLFSKVSLIFYDIINITNTIITNKYYQINLNDTQ